MFNHHLQELSVSLGLSHTRRPTPQLLLRSYWVTSFSIYLSAPGYIISISPRETDSCLLRAQHISTQLWMESSLFFIILSPNYPLDSAPWASLHQLLPFSGPQWPTTMSLPLQPLTSLAPRTGMSRVLLPASPYFVWRDGTIIFLIVYYDLTFFRKQSPHPFVGRVWLLHEAPTQDPLPPSSHHRHYRMKSARRILHPGSHEASLVISPYFLW